VGAVRWASAGRLLEEMPRDRVVDKRLFTDDGVALGVGVNRQGNVT
jgi:hypothetical protein